MLKSIFYPTTQTAFVWISALYLIFLLIIGKADAMTILFVYFVETLIIGVFNALKMYKTIAFRKNEDGKVSFVLIPFFIFHYGFFVAIQSIFGFALFGMEATNFIKEPFHIIENYGLIFQLEGIQYALPAIVFNHLGNFFFDFIKNKKYTKFEAHEIMFKPYVRIIIQQFVVILSFFFIAFGNAGLIAALILIALRLCIDLGLNAIKEDSEILDYLSSKLANQKASKEEIKKQLLNFTE